MKIQYASDLHLEFSANSSYLKLNPLKVTGDILILAGDIGYLGDDNYSKHPFWDWASENYQRVIIALGNHEFYKYYDIATLPKGLCGEIRHNVNYYYMSSSANTKIVVTHHVPSFQMLSPEFIGSRANGAFTVELSEYIEQSGIDYWVYGHSHRNMDVTIGRTECICNQLGYVFANEHSSFVPDKMIIVE